MASSPHCLLAISGCTIPGLLHPLPGREQPWSVTTIIPSSSQTSNTRARQCLGEPEIPFCFTSFPPHLQTIPSYYDYPLVTGVYSLHTAGSAKSHPSPPCNFSPGSASPSCSSHPPAAFVWAFQIARGGSGVCWTIVFILRLCQFHGGWVRPHVIAVTTLVEFWEI